MVNYYTLEEAARILGTTPDELRKQADRNEIRAFRDRGNLRFRTQDIEERARQLGRGSDPDLQPGDSHRHRPSDSPAPRKAEPDVFAFELSPDDTEQVDLGSVLKAEQPSSSSKKGSGKAGSKLGPPSPPPKAGSDSDVRLVPEGSDVDFHVAGDSDVKIVQEPPPPPPSSKKPLVRRKTGAPSDPQQDSGVRIVPLDSGGDDGSISLGSPSPKSASDSDVRLQPEPGSSRRGGSKKAGKVEPPVTEEIDLDAELRQAGGSGRSRGPRGKPPTPVLPTASPFELSDSEIEAARPGQADLGGDSSDQDLSPVAPRDSSPLELDSDEEVTLGELGGGRGSGINLRDPADSGISLEQGSDDDNLEVNLAAGTTPKPAKAGSGLDSSSDFELSLDSESPSSKSGAEADSDNEFELSLDADEGPASGAEADSDSEFELTLDDTGGLAPLEGEEDASEERDIFETDFEVPALDEESGSQAVALDEPDTDLESSDFDLAVGEDEDSQSQVMAIGDEDDEVEAVTKPRRRRAVDDEEEEDAEDAERAPAAVAAAPPAQWGILPALALFPCVILMFLVGLMAFELVHGMWGYHQPQKVSGLIIRPMAEMFTDDLPKQ